LRPSDPAGCPTKVGARRLGDPDRHLRECDAGRCDRGRGALHRTGGGQRHDTQLDRQGRMGAHADPADPARSPPRADRCPDILAAERKSRMTARDIVFLLAAASSLAMGALAVARRPRGMLRWSFALGMAGFALESATAFVLVTQTDAPDERLFWLKATLIAGLLLVVPWGIFVAALTLPGARLPSRRDWLGLGCGAAVTAA